MTRRRHRNLNGLHHEALAPHQFARLPPPTTPLKDMEHLLHGQSVSRLLERNLERHALL